MLAKEQDIKLKQVFSELDRKFEEEETQRKAQKNQLPHINLFGFPIDQSALAILSKEKAEETGVIIFYKDDKRLKLGLVEKNPAADKVLAALKGQGYSIEVYLISHSSLKSALSLYQKIVSAPIPNKGINIDSKQHVGDIVSLKDFADKITSVSATELVDLILGAALSLDSSDIHIEPELAGTKIRIRIDGVLQDIAMLPKQSHQVLISRIKALGKLKFNVSAQPQDGSFSIKYNNFPVDIRVSLLPSAFGESAVLRLLRQDKGTLKFQDLGITGLALERLLAQMQKPNGMILTTGPTGSGKTTTLYAILNRLNEPGVKIITLEDPVEYRIEGITQTPIDRNAGFTFAAGLRSILRQDPDVVMVGEMRDLETAETAAQAALTGHIVLSTLHTNDAAGALPRLLDLGVKSFILSSAINAVIAQRLVRKICTKCKVEQKAEKSLLSRAELILNAIPKSSKVKLPEKLVFYHSPGCPACKGLGYKGRIGIYEAFIMNEAIEAMIAAAATTSDIRNQAIKDGMITMAQDGVLKALAGITDLEEVFRVTEE